MHTFMRYFAGLVNIFEIFDKFSKTNFQYPNFYFPNFYFET